VNIEEPRKKIISYLMDKAQEAILSADSEQKENRLAFAVNRGYYACFYVLSAVLLKRNLSFKRHSGVRAALHTRLISTGAGSRRTDRTLQRVRERDGKVSIPR